MKIKKLMLKALSLPTTAIAYRVSQELAALYPDKALVEGSECSFNLQAYAHAEKCTIEQKVSVHNQIATNWDGMEHHIHKGAVNAWFEVAWQGNTLDVLIMSWRERWDNIQCYWILADTKEIAESFLAAVCEWNGQIREEVLVFEEGHWSKSPDLFRAIKGANFDNLILRGSLKQEIQDDLTNFFASRQTYETYGVPWKRGILFIGTP
ncbi:MAG TPA: hypothetical protein V6C93_28165, partial [Allocoleopsis sp.]